MGKRCAYQSEIIEAIKYPSNVKQGQKGLHKGTVKKISKRLPTKKTLIVIIEETAKRIYIITVYYKK